MKTKTLIKTGEKKIDKLFTDFVELRNFFMEQKEDSLFFKSSLNGLQAKSDEIRDFLHQSQEDIVNQFNELAYTILEPSQPTGLTKENALQMYTELLRCAENNEMPPFEFNRKVSRLYAFKINALNNEMNKLSTYHRYLFEVEQSIHQISDEINERLMEVNARLLKQMKGGKE